MSSVCGIPSPNLGDRAKFFSLPAQVIHNLVPVPTEMLKAKTTSCLKLPFCHLSFIELPLPLSFSYGTCQTVPCIFNAYELHVCYTAPERGAFTYRAVSSWHIYYCLDGTDVESSQIKLTFSYRRAYLKVPSSSIPMPGLMHGSPPSKNTEPYLTCPCHPAVKRTMQSSSSSSAQ